MRGALAAAVDRVVYARSRPASFRGRLAGPGGGAWKAGFVKRVFDPIHHFIELEDGEAALLDTPPMQRLRRLRQLGLAYLAFPAA
jgi:hypothetical protein